MEVLDYRKKILNTMEEDFNRDRDNLSRPQETWMRDQEESSESGQERANPRHEADLGSKATELQDQAEDASGITRQDWGAVDPQQNMPYNPDVDPSGPGSAV
jgi:hypothetical protein